MKKRTFFPLWDDQIILAWREQVWNLLDPKLLADWFQSKGDAPVGKGHDTCGCPLYNYYAEKLPMLDVHIGHRQFFTPFQEEGYLYYLGNRTLQCEHDVPEWASKLIQKIDDASILASPDYKEYWIGNIQKPVWEIAMPITGNDCHHLLSQINL